MNETFEMVAKTLYGLEEILAGELLALGANDLQIGRRMVSFTGDKELLYKANFHCRTALRILKPIYHFKAKDADTVYKEVKKIEWEKYLSLDKTFAIDSVIYSEDFNHSKFVAYRTKDAIVDYFIEKFNKRPSVRISNPDLYINIHISHNDCTLSIDSSGESLHKRGYRAEQTEAPLNEVLAAGMIMKTGWKGESNFIDPMCGSGTLLIEAALIALNIAPGVYRKEFAFQKWVDYDEELFNRIYNDDSQERSFDFMCYGSDISQQAIDIAVENVRGAGMGKYISLKTMPFQQYTEAPKPGILVMNPPYGERISSHDLLGLYAIIGERLKHVFSGYKAWIISYKEECFDKIGLRPSEKMKLMNGSLECEFRCYEMFDGKNKDYKRALNERGEKSDTDRGERRFNKEKSFNRDERPDFTRRMDRPERRFLAAHSENEEEREAAMPGRRRQREDQEGREDFRRRGEGRPAKMRYRNEEEKSFGDRKKSFGDRDRKREFGDRKRDKRGGADYKRDNKRSFDKRGKKSGFRKDFREDDED